MCAHCSEGFVERRENPRIADHSREWWRSMSDRKEGRTRAKTIPTPWRARSASRWDPRLSEDGGYLESGGTPGPKPSAMSCQAADGTGHRT
jgi:hypothetical protein